MPQDTKQTQVPTSPAPAAVEPEVVGLEAKHLAAQLGLNPKRCRAYLRQFHPRTLEVKGKRWTIPLPIAQQIVSEYKAKQAAKAAPKVQQIQADLAGATKK